MHQEKHLRNSDFLTDIVIGMSDGLTVPFALAAGLSGAAASTSIIVIAGIAEIAAGSIAMGLGGYLAGKTEQDHYQTELKREYEEVDNTPEKEKQEVKSFFANIGLSEEMQEKAVEEIARDRDQWVAFMMKHELGLEKPDPRRATKSALNIGLSYAIGGLVPLSPYFFTSHPIDGLKISAALTLIFLFIFGFFKSRITGVNPWAGALRVTLIGALAASAAFGVARLFE
ncbi:MAG: VIT1/CCC1 transporter family protein [Sphingobacteriales bacterium]|nr:VIT1/CCC1 transporter family protein [Sphingobacteriales bacterium]OJW38455.1 MAG: iron transporter [Sphingobacteriales bacterium 46-32]